MINVACPTRNDFSVKVQQAVVLSGEISITRRKAVIEPIKSSVSETATEATNFDGSLAQYPRSEQ